MLEIKARGKGLLPSGFKFSSIFLPAVSYKRKTVIITSLVRGTAKYYGLFNKWNCVPIITQYNII
jgi:hypothetical protein